MKKFLLLLTVSLSLTVSYGQTNLYFQNNPVWQGGTTCCYQQPCIIYHSYNYYTNGDTVIKSYLYKQIFKKGTTTYSWNANPPAINCSGSGWFIDTVSSFFLRSINKQIFLRQPQDTVEYLLYDFNLAVGDTLPFTYNNLQNDIYVSSIDSVYTLHGYLKRFALAGNTDTQYLIEGIGSTNGLVEPISDEWVCLFGLNCYSLNDTACYPTTGPSCNLTVGVIPVDNISTISVSPNPFSTQTTLETAEHLTNASLTVYNSVGQTVKRMANLTGQTFVFYRDDLPGGLYFVRLTQDGNTISADKFVISDN